MTAAPLSLIAARHIIASGTTGLGLGSLIALAAPLVMPGTWSWSSVFVVLPYAVSAVLCLMLISAARDWLAASAARRYAAVEAWLVAIAAVLAGAAQFLETPLIHVLRPWIMRRDLPSIIFAASLTVLLLAVCFAWDRQVSKFKRLIGRWLIGDVQRILVGAGTIVLIFIGHLSWLGFADAMDKSVNYQPNVNPFEMIGFLVLSVVVFGLLVGFCINRALSGPPPSPELKFSETASVDARHDYTWLDFAPRRPFRTIYEDRLAKIVPVLVIFAASGIAIGWMLWRDQWIGTSILGGLLGLFAAGVYSAAVNWGYRNSDLTAPVEELVQRRAFVKKKDASLHFIVVTEDGSSTGKVLIDRPWDDVAEFSRSRYSDVFGIGSERPFKNHDWSVIIMVPASGAPQMVGEMIGTLQNDYATLAGLVERFDPRARSRFRQTRKPAPIDVGSEPAGTIPMQL